MKQFNSLLLTVFFVSSLLLIGINYSTIKVLSAVRAYINGESEYSKGQKDASLLLAAYVESGNDKYWISFTEAIGVPQSDKLARLYMEHDSSRTAVEKAFLGGRNNKADIPEMITLYKTFRNWKFMKDALVIWHDGDGLIDELYIAGITAHERIMNKTMAEEEEQRVIKNINELSGSLSEKERAFSGVLGVIARKINVALLWVNIFCILIITATIATYAVRTVNKLATAKKQTEDNNIELANANRELDTFVYSLSHDLRSPITSIKGLTYIASSEQNLRVVKDYMVTIGEVIDKQDAFIKEIIDFFRNKRASVVLKPLSLKTVVDDIIKVNRYIPGAHEIAISTDIAADAIVCDELRIKMILANLVSNAIKYSDDKKPDRKVAIRTYVANGQVQMEVEDNGVGIEKEYFDKIFNMFFVTPNNNRGTGLGLYILKQNVDKLGGKVYVTSKVNEGTKFTINLPCLLA